MRTKRFGKGLGSFVPGAAGISLVGALRVVLGAAQPAAGQMVFATTQRLGGGARRRSRHAAWAGTRIC